MRQRNFMTTRSAMEMWCMPLKMCARTIFSAGLRPLASVMVRPRHVGSATAPEGHR